MCVALLLWTLHSSGCGIPEVKREPELTALAAQLDTIETVQLADMSKSAPVTIEEATRSLTTGAAEPNTPRQAVRLTLDEVRAAALANNLDLKVQLIEPALAEQAVDIERARFESVFFGSGRYTRNDLDDDGAFSSRFYEAGVSTPLHTGGEITASLPVTNAGGVTEAAASVSVIQSLLRGAGTRVNLYSIQVAGYQRDSMDAFTKLQAIYNPGRRRHRLLAALYGPQAARHQPGAVQDGPESTEIRARQGGRRLGREDRDRLRGSGSLQPARRGNQR